MSHYNVTYLTKKNGISETGFYGRENRNLELRGQAGRAEATVKGAKRQSRRADSLKVEVYRFQNTNLIILLKLA